MEYPTAYLKRTCPFSLRFRIFLSETGLQDHFHIVVFDDGDATHQQLRRRLKQAGLQPSFPAVEQSEGQFQTGSDDLITQYARQVGVDPSHLPLLDYYTQGVFQELLAHEKSPSGRTDRSENHAG